MTNVHAQIAIISRQSNPNVAQDSLAELVHVLHKSNDKVLFVQQKGLLYTRCMVNFF